MSRNDYNEGAGKMGNNKKQNDMVRRAAREVGISERDLSAEIHDWKETWYDGDFKYQELLEIAREIKRRKNR